MKFWAMLLLFCLPLGAQTNNIGNPIPANLFGFTVYDINGIQPPIIPALPYSTSRSWDAFHVSWAYLNQCNNTYTWGALDAYTTANAGKDMVYTFGVVPDWAASDPSANTPYPLGSGAACADGSTSIGGTSCSMPSITAWDTFVTAIANHAPQIKYWEQWNEPMNTPYWCVPANGPYNSSAATFAQYALMAEHAYKIIKSIIPGAVILSPSPDKAFGLTWLNNYYAAMPACTTGYTFGCGTQVAWDVMAVHGYPDNAPEGIVAMLSTYASWNSAHGGAVPIWDTETALGTQSASDATQLAKMFILSWSSGLSREIYYAYDNDGVTLCASGCNTSSPTLTTAGVGYQQTYNWLVGATMTSACSQDGAGTYTCPLSRSGYAGRIVWNGSTTVSYPATGFNRYRDLAGNVTGVSASTVSVSNSPILLEYTAVPTNIQVF